MNTNAGPYSPGDRVRVWRGARPGRSYPAKVLAEAYTLGDTPGVPVRWADARGEWHTDFIALTHVEAVEKGSDV